MKFRAFVISLVAALLIGLLTTGLRTATAQASPVPRLQVAADELVDADGNQVVLHGVDITGPESQCVKGKGIFASPVGQMSVAAMKHWGVDAVRVPLNEACWNGESYVRPAFSGLRYRNAIEAYVTELNANGIVAILDLHWTDGSYTGKAALCSSAQATCQKPMPDLAGSVRFWSSVARSFRNDDSVIFDLFNEPYPNRALPTETAAWECWRDGGASCSPGISYPVAGMQTLVDTVRATGARNVIMLGGLDFANDLSDWLQYQPADPDHEEVASWHSYNTSGCNTESCWTANVAPVMASVPVIAGEIGENDCADDYIDPLMAFLDSDSSSYLAWVWNTSVTCTGGPSLITSYDGTPTAYGAGYRSHLRSFADRRH